MALFSVHMIVIDSLTGGARDYPNVLIIEKRASQTMLLLLQYIDISQKYELRTNNH